MVDTADNQQEDINAEFDDAGGAKLFERSRIKALAGEHNFVFFYTLNFMREVINANVFKKIWGRPSSFTWRERGPYFPLLICRGAGHICLNLDFQQNFP